jgi:simple sugar transport system substrate-binding protein
MRRVLHYVLAALLVLGLAVFVAACGGDDDKDSSSKKDDVSLTQGRDLTIAVITHGEGDTFWAVAKKGAEQAGKDMGVTVKYSESQNDPQKHAQLIDSAVTEKVDGIATSVPNADALRDPLKKAADAGIPIITLNSGQSDSASLGAITHVGQDEGVAGEAALPKVPAENSSALSTSRATQGSRSAAPGRRRASADRSKTSR